MSESGDQHSTYPPEELISSEEIPKLLTAHTDSRTTETFLRRKLSLIFFAGSFRPLDLLPLLAHPAKHGICSTNIEHKIFQNVALFRKFMQE